MVDEGHANAGTSWDTLGWRSVGVVKARVIQRGPLRFFKNFDEALDVALGCLFVFKGRLVVGRGFEKGIDNQQWGGAEVFLRSIDKMRRAIPGLTLRTSFIVGFPGETEEEFAELCDFVREAEFDWMGTFSYSDQEGAGAYGLGRKLSLAEIERRRKHLMGIQRQISKKKKKSLVGQEFDLLLEGSSEETDLLMEGRTAMHAPEIDGKVFVNEFPAEAQAPARRILSLSDCGSTRLRLTMADSLPGLGIVAAVLGVVITMGALGGPPEEIGKKVAAALVGTFLGILLCYGLVGPLASRMSKIADEQHSFLFVLRVTMIAFLKGVAPIMAVEIGRRTVPGHVRPSFQAIEEACRGAKDAPAAAAEAAAGG